MNQDIDRRSLWLVPRLDKNKELRTLHALASRQFGNQAVNHLHITLAPVFSLAPEDGAVNNLVEHAQNLSILASGIKTADEQFKSLYMRLEGESLKKIYESCEDLVGYSLDYFSAEPHISLVYGELSLAAVKEFTQTVSFSSFTIYGFDLMVFDTTGSHASWHLVRDISAEQFLD